MEMTAIVATLLAAAGGLVVLATFGLRSAAVHRQALLAAGVGVADRLHLWRITGRCRALVAWVRSRRPGWQFGTTATLGLVIVAAVAAGAGKLVDDVTDGEGVAVLATRWPTSLRRTVAGHSRWLCGRRAAQAIR